MKSSVLVLMSSILTVGLLYAGQKFNGMSNGWLVIGAFIAVYIVLQITITVVSEYSKGVGRKESYGTHAKEKTNMSKKFKAMIKNNDVEEDYDDEYEEECPPQPDMNIDIK